MKKQRSIILFIACTLFATTGFSQRYSAGDIVENFTLTNRETNQPVSLHDLEGKIVFLEWFAYWCPFCQAAAADVKTGIVDHYKAQGGNVNGVPVLHVGINLQDNAEGLTQNFVDRFGLELVLNDFNRGLANRFQSGGQPIFAIINGVANSPSNQQWELLYTRLGYGDFIQPIPTFRQVIDSVQAAPSIQAPTITSQPQPARLATGTTLELTVGTNGDELAYTWQRDGSTIAGQNTATLTIENLGIDAAGAYTVKVSNAAGEATSQTVDIEVIQSMQDYLIQAGLTGNDLDQDADPDQDGHANAFEYLSQTNPNDPLDVPNATLLFTQENGVPAIRIQTTTSPDTIGVSLAAHLWAYPASAGSFIQPLPIGESSNISQPFPAGAKTFLARLVATATANE